MENRLISGISHGNTFTYDYDPRGRRIAKTVNGVKTEFLHAGDMEIAEYGENGEILRRYIPGGAIDERVIMIEGPTSAPSAFRYYHADRLGNVAAITNSNGRVVERYAYDAFGNEVTGANLSGNLFRYTSRKFDPETGLYYYRARYYAPDLGSFLSTDPVGYEDQRNLYTYVANNPLNFVDPTGLACERTSNAVSDDAATVVCQNDGEAFESIEEAVASVAENLINFTNETGFEAFAVIQETADGFVVTDAVSTGGEDTVDIDAALDILGISDLSHDFRIGDVHTHPGTDFGSGLFSEDDVIGNQRALGPRLNYSQYARSVARAMAERTLRLSLS